MLPGGIETAIPRSEQQRTHALDREETGMGHIP
jgi:hypothetical protein